MAQDKSPLVPVKAVSWMYTRAFFKECTLSACTLIANTRKINIAGTRTQLSYIDLDSRRFLSPSQKSKPTAAHIDEPRPSVSRPPRLPFCACPIKCYHSMAERRRFTLSLGYLVGGARNPFLIVTTLPFLQGRLRVVVFSYIYIM